MSNHEEEQALEIEALQSIFEEGKEFERVSDVEFLLKLLPYPAGEEENHVGVTFHVTYTPDYPDSPPNWSLENIKGLPDEKVDMLRSTIEEAISSALGMAMVYTVAEACQDFLKQHNQKALSMHEEMMQRLAEKDGGEANEEDEEEGEEDGEELPNPEEEWKGLTEKLLCPESERITPESFAAWKAKFVEEMVACGTLRREENRAKSGKQIFLEAQGRDGAAPAGAEGEKPGVLVYDAALFGEDGVEDLDDLSGGDD